MQFGFQNLYSGSTRDGKNWTAVEPLLTYLAEDGSVYRLKLGATTDGPTGVPEPFRELLWRSAAFHDGCYRDQVEKVGEGGGWFPFHPTKEQSDYLFGESMASCGVSEIEQRAVLMAVVLFGGKFFREDRA